MALGDVIEFKGNKRNLKTDNVEFKGSKKGLVINIKNCNDFEKVKQEIVQKIECAGRFFIGAKIASINSETMTDLQKIELKEIISSKFQIEFVEEESVFDGINEGQTKFVKATLRSGMKIEFKGNVVVIGDVNPGAQIVAYGNVIIMGCLRGVVHAGANGNKDAFVVAYDLNPMQLRIENLISIAPDEEFEKPNYPEIAFIKDNFIVIEPYLNKR
ncbi:septum site-determining protein MinC [Tepidibacter hydrothermalis]|uniref:Probable septum site-determining protein MinC n=1 Tax=Tepidibacter hydrothermalis TaxID=3036126 RepID=A0ABY8EES1_9FIRM|nr:septum site-determining protein MinC [Tepidibacter hydrothermalis]WFD11454.1 septum site-determining protein MinC [Tepidibacter hydrothermalis]